MKRVIFVCGAARCGTTLVDLVLGNDPRGFSLGEVVGWYRPWRTHHFDIKCGCGVYPCPVWEQFRDYPEDELAMELLNRLDLDFLVDSSKVLPWVIDRNLSLARRHPELGIFNVFLYKEPVALYYSHWKRGETQIESIPGLYEYYAQAIKARLPFVTVSYDWFVGEAPQALETLCTLLGIPFFPGKEAFWEKEHHHLFGSFGPRRQLSAAKPPRIYREEYASEFAEQVPVFEAWFEKNARLGELMRELKARDAREVGAYPSRPVPRIRKPLFYYRKKLRAMQRRFFPQRFPDKEASLIRDWRF